MRSAATLTVAYLPLILQSTVLELAPVHMAVPSFALLVVVAPPPAPDPEPGSHHAPGRGLAVIK